MSIGVKDNGIGLKLTRELAQAQKQHTDAIEKLSSGQVFTTNNPNPSLRAISEKMEFKLRGITQSKQNINNAISLFQTAESALSEINNIILRMKELNVSAANSTITDKDRLYLFVEYQALFDEINRIATTTEFNGIPLLNGNDKRVPEEFVFRIGDSLFSGSNNYRRSRVDEPNVIRFDGFKSIIATTEGLGIKDARRLIDKGERHGISIGNAQALLKTKNKNYSTIYDAALDILASNRAVLGAIQSRLQQSLDYLDVYHENISAAKSSITDTDYAKEIVKLTESNILMQATTGLLAQSNLSANLSLSLLSNIIK